MSEVSLFLHRQHNGAGWYVTPNFKMPDSECFETGVVCASGLGFWFDIADRPKKIILKASRTKPSDDNFYRVCFIDPGSTNYPFLLMEAHAENNWVNPSLPTYTVQYMLKKLYGDRHHYGFCPPRNDIWYLWAEK